AHGRGGRGARGRLVERTGPGASPRHGTAADAGASLSGAAGLRPCGRNPPMRPRRFALSLCPALLMSVWGAPVRVAAAEPEVLPPAEIVRQALAHSYAVRSAGREVEATQARESQTKAQRLPH